VNILFAAGLYSHGFLYNFYLLELGLRERVLGNAAAALTLGGLIALIPAGFFVDRYGARNAYMAAGVLLAAGLALGALARVPLTIYAAAIIAGAGTAAWRVAMGPMLMQLTTDATRARAFSWNVGLLVGSGALWTALAGAAPGWISAVTSTSTLRATQGALLLGAAGSLVAIVLLWSLRAEGAGETAREMLPGSNQWTRHQVPMRMAVLIAVIALWMTAGGLVIPFLNLFFHREHGVPVDRVGALFATAQLVGAAVIFLSGEASSRWGPVRPLLVWSLAFGPLLWALGAADALWLASVLFVVQSVIAPATNALIDQALMERAPIDRRGVVSGWRNAATEASGFVGASAGGRILEQGSFSLLLGLAGAVALAGAILVNVVLTAWRRGSGERRESDG